MTNTTNVKPCPWILTGTAACVYAETHGFDLTDPPVGPLMIDTAREHGERDAFEAWSDGIGDDAPTRLEYARRQRAGKIESPSTELLNAFGMWEALELTGACAPPLRTCAMPDADSELLESWCEAYDAAYLDETERLAKDAIVAPLAVAVRESLSPNCLEVLAAACVGGAVPLLDRDLHRVMFCDHGNESIELEVLESECLGGAEGERTIAGWREYVAAIRSAIGA